ncbi:MAG: hypothetical protein WD071_10865 [Pseudohongiella sp.]|uniref:hypothetical protein n=1 Tax=Pseudohongiella sp. TaxID=1979412 RepID=UPI0034A05414
MNMIHKIRDLANRAITAHMKGEYTECILAAKRLIEQICKSLLKKKGVTFEVYIEKQNRHQEWGLEKIIKECEERGLIPESLATELMLVKDWRNNLEHDARSSKSKSLSSISLETSRKIYSHALEVLDLPTINRWPDNIEIAQGNMLPFDPIDIAWENGQLIAIGSKGQRAVIDFRNDAASWIDEFGNKKIYKGNISEANSGKGWAG